MSAPSNSKSGWRTSLINEIREAETFLSQRGRLDEVAYAEQFLHIRTKDKRVIRFPLNAPQLAFARALTGRDMLLKARQMGFTTLICALFFADTVLHANTTSVIVAHDSDSTQRIFQIVKLFWERLPDEEKERIGKPQYSNRREFFWPKLNSWFYVGTAGSTAFGRGQTINNLHCSELAFWPDPETKLGALLEAVPANGRIIYETTPNGMGNLFHTLWKEAQDGESDFAPHFFPWFADPSYALDGDPLGDLSAEEAALQAAHALTEGQLRWRRSKQRSSRSLFAQEYAEDDVSCFIASGRCVFDADALRRALDRIAAEPSPERIVVLPWRSGRGGLTSAEIAIAPATLTVWRRPESGKRYLVGADVAEGLPDGDASCAQVLDRGTGEQVAELHGHVSPERFAFLLAALGDWYGTAYIGVERENHGHSTLNTLRNTLRYYHLYHHRRYDKGSESERILGWPTDAQTRPVLVDDLIAAIANDLLRIHSPGLVDEMFTFVSNPRTGKQEAQEGKHDDRVMSLGIAWQVRSRRMPMLGNQDDLATAPTFAEAGESAPQPVRIQGGGEVGSVSQDGTEKPATGRTWNLGI